MRWLIALLASAVLVVAACGDDDGTENLDATDTEQSTTVPGETDDTGNPSGAGTDPDADADADAEDDAPSEAGTAVQLPTSEEICDVVTTAAGALYGAPTQVEPDDGTYAACDVRFEAHRVVVSAFAVDDPLVGGDFDTYIDQVSESIDGLEPMEGVGDGAYANETGTAYVLIGDQIFTISRAFSTDGGDPTDIGAVVEAIASTLVDVDSSSGDEEAAPSQVDDEQSPDVDGRRDVVVSVALAVHGDHPRPPAT